MSSHHHACSNPTKPLAFSGSPSPRALCATLLSSEGWACGEQRQLRREELSGQCSEVEEGGEEMQSRPTSPAPITQAKKTKFFFFFGASLLNARRSPDFGQRKGIICVCVRHNIFFCNMHIATRNMHMANFFTQYRYFF